MTGPLLGTITLNVNSLCTPRGSAHACLTLTSTEHALLVVGSSSLSHWRPQGASSSSSPGDPCRTSCAQAPVPSRVSQPHRSPWADGQEEDRGAQRRAPSTQLTHRAAQRPGPARRRASTPSPAGSLCWPVRTGLGLTGSHRASHRASHGQPLRGPTALTPRTRVLVSAFSWLSARSPPPKWTGDLRPGPHQGGLAAPPMAQGADEAGAKVQARQSHRCPAHRQGCPWPLPLQSRPTTVSARGIGCPVHLRVPPQPHCPVLSWFAALTAQVPSDSVRRAVGVASLRKLSIPGTRVGGRPARGPSKASKLFGQALPRHEG